MIKNLPAIVLFQETGELGNRLVTYSFLLSAAREHSLTISNLCFWRYARYFNYSQYLIEQPYDDDLRTTSEVFTRIDDVMGEVIASALRISRLDGIRKKLVFQGVDVCKPSELILRGLNSALSKLCLSSSRKHKSFGSYLVREVAPWHHTCAYLASEKADQYVKFEQRLIEKHADYLRRRFQLISPIQLIVNELILALRQQSSILVGIHLRRGDYMVYHGGQWCFSNKTFLCWMEAIQSHFQGKSVRFVIASNETITLEDFMPFQVFKAPGNPITDLYTLAACDLIVGPPSTFSGWASFMGNVPIHFITDASVSENLNIAEFATWLPRFF